MRWLNKLIVKTLGGKVRLIEFTQEQEKSILQEMRKIEGIEKYWQLQRQCAQQLFCKTREEKYLGIAELAESLVNLLNKPNVESEENDSTDGYQSTV